MPKFDPMTGELITEETDEKGTASISKNQFVPRFDPMTGQPIRTAQPQSHKTAIIVSIIVGVVVLLGIFTFALAVVLFSNPRTTVERACAKTFSEGGYLYDALKDVRGIGKEYTVTSNIQIDMQSEYSDGSIAFYTQMGVEGKDKQLAGTIEYNNSFMTIPEIEYKMQIDEQEARFQIPTIDNHVFTYNYMEEKHGYLTEVGSAEQLQRIDDVLKIIYSSESPEDIKNTELGVKLTNFYRSLKVERSDAGQFEVDGNIRKCKGYAILVTQEDMNRFREIYQEYTEQIFADIQNMETATIRFYVYQKKLACVELEFEGNIYQVVFHGGDYRIQNVEMIVNDVTVCSIEGELAGDEESISMDFEEERAAMTYNRSTGAYDIKSENAYEKIEMNGILSIGNKEIRLTVDQFALDGESDYTLSGDIAVTRGAVIDTMKGETFDIGSASEEQYNELFDDLNKMLYGLSGY